MIGVSLTEKRDYKLLLGKLVINLVFAICLLLLADVSSFNDDAIIAFLIGQIYAVLSYDKSGRRFAIYSIIFMLSCLAMVQCALFVALGFIFTRHLKWTTLLAALALLYYVIALSLTIQTLLTILLALLAFSIAYLGQRYQFYRTAYERQRDMAHETAYRYQSREGEIEQLIDSKAQASVLAERNRIAGELHDHIGHTISSAIVQAEAYKALYLNAPPTEQMVAQRRALDGVIKTLKDGMIDIRTSLHHLRNSALDFDATLRAMQSKYPGLELSLYLHETATMPYDMKQKLIRLVSEVLANTVKHADATQLKISVVRQRDFYSVTAKDNGSPRGKVKMGIGLTNMQALADSYRGSFNYGYQNGFYVHLTLYLSEA